MPGACLLLHLLQIPNYIVPPPVVTVIHGSDLPRRIEQSRAQAMHDLVALLVVREPKEVRKRSCLPGVGGPKLPVLKLRIDSSGETVAVIFQDWRRVKLRIDADTQHLQLAVKPRV